MKGNLSYLYNTRKAILNYSSISTILGSIVLLAFALLATNCGPPPTAEYIVPETNVKSLPVQTQGKLPETANIQLHKLGYLKEVFKRPPRVTSFGGLDDFVVMSRKDAKNRTIVSDCSFDILKAFVAHGWAPVVKYEFHGRTWEILPISEYNDHMQLISLQNPNHISKRRVNYKDFEASWSKSSQNKCVLITPSQITERDVRKVLGKYLPKEAFKQITFKQITFTSR